MYSEVCSEIMCGSQCFYFSRNIGQVTPNTVCFYYRKKYFPDQSIQKNKITGGSLQDRTKGAERLLPIVKMTQKFMRSKNVDATEDIAKKTYYMSQDTIRIDYHVVVDRLTNSYRVYTKDGHSHVVQVGEQINLS